MRRWIRLIFKCLALLVAIVLCVYLWSRITSGSKRVLTRVIELSEPASDSNPALIVGCYNIAHGRGGEFGAGNRRADGKAGLIAHLKKIGALLREEELDIVVLNEVDFSSSWSWGINQTEIIAKEAGLPYVMEQRNYDMSAVFYELRFGNAILSRYPVSRAQRVDLPEFKKHESVLIGQKQAAGCLIETPPGTVRVTAVHLEHRDEETRQKSMRTLSGFYEEDKSVPHLFMGDFNTADVFPASTELNKTGPELLTFPSEKPDRAIDWIIPSPKVQTGDLQTFGGDLSDHLGLKATLREITVDKTGERS